MKKTLFFGFLASAFLLFSATSYAQHFTAVTAGTQFNLALRSDSTLWGWGFNENGQLATGDTLEVLAPIQVATSQKWIAVSAGSFNSLGIAADSTLWGWGISNVGQIGLGVATSINDTPIQVSASHWRSISSGFFHSAAIRADGTLWETGNNFYGGLGTGDTTSSLSFIQVGTDNDWKMVSVGGAHTLALKNNGTIWGWGLNQNGELGMGNTDTVMSPTQIGTDNSWSMISAGFEFSLVLKSDGTLWSSGFNGNGQLGRNASAIQDSALLQIGTDSDWRFISAGASFGFAIKQDSTLWGWGYNGAGQLGITAASNVPSPTVVGTDHNWVFITAARGAEIGSSVFGLHSAGFKAPATSICTTGDNSGGQLGNGTASTTPQEAFDCSIAQITTGIAAATAENEEILLFPNPASDYIDIRLPSSLAGQQVSLEIIDVSGKVCVKQVLSQSGNVNVRSLVNGVYFVHISNGSDVFYKQPFVKQ